MSQIVIPNDIFFANLIDELETSGHVLLNVKGYSMFPFFRNENDAALLRPFDRAAGLKRGSGFMGDISCTAALARLLRPTSFRETATARERNGPDPRMLLLSWKKE